ncbi:MAG: hypothetical protein ACPGWS_09195 [Solirubrobacterales bacterium]
MALAYGMLLGNFYATAQSMTIVTVGSHPVSISAGLHYPWGYSGESTEQYLEAVEAGIQAAHATLSSAALSIDVSTGFVTIDLGTSGQITAMSSDLRDILGFDGVTIPTGTSQTHVGTEPMRYLWRPTKYISGHPVDRDQVWAPETTGQVVRSADATAYGIEGEDINETFLTWQNLPENDAIINPSSAASESFEHFYRDVLRGPKPFRYVPDRASYTSSSYVECMLGNGMVPRFTQLCRRIQPNTNVLWRVHLAPVVEFSE